MVMIVGAEIGEPWEFVLQGIKQNFERSIPRKSIIGQN